MNERMDNFEKCKVGISFLSHIKKLMYKNGSAVIVQLNTAADFLPVFFNSR